MPGEWQPRHSLEIHDEWWEDWSRDKNHDKIDDRLAWLLTQPNDVYSQWWKRADPGYARVFVDYDHHPSTADVKALEDLGATVTFLSSNTNALIWFSFMTSVPSMHATSTINWQSHNSSLML